MRDGRLMPLLGLLLIGGLALLIGCESDETAPNDPLPALTPEDAASQAAIPAMAMTQIGPALAGYDGNKGLKNVYEYDFGGDSDIDGRVLLDFRLDGEPATYEEANWGRMYTEEDSPLVIVIEGMLPGLELTVDVTGDPYDPDAQTATLGGSGSITIGDFEQDWTIEGVVVSADGFPDDGVLTFTTEGIEVEVHYDGDATADVYVDEEMIGTINLGNGTFQEI